jgi:hypothetical protein
MLLDDCCGSTTRSMIHDFLHAMIFSMACKNHKGLSCSDLQKEEGCLPEKRAKKDGPVLG